MIKSFKNKLALLLAVVVAFSSFALFGCGNDKADDTKTTTSANENTSATEDEVADVTEEEKVPTLAKVYKPSQAFQNGKEVHLDTVFGTGYAQYGDELVFNEDGTFTAYIGVTAGADSSTGTYKIVGTTGLELCYNNDKTESAVLTTVDVNNNVVDLRLEKNDYYIIFVSENN